MAFYALLLFTGFATALHVFIFYLETIAWESPLAKKTFGLTAQQAAQTKEMAANQGVYNLLLAIVSAAGLAAYLAGAAHVGLALILAGCGSMAAAALYLFFSSDKKQAAMKQLVFPFLAVIAALVVL